MRMRKKKNLLPRMERCAALQIKDPIAHRGHWRELMPEARELRVELGCGKGRFTAGTAAAEPDVLFVAVEMVPDAMVVAMERCAAEGLRNVRFIDANANILPEFFAPGEVDRIYINFCDPWPTKRHAKRRLTQDGQRPAFRLVGGGDPAVWLYALRGHRRSARERRRRRDDRLRGEIPRAGRAHPPSGRHDDAVGGAGGRITAAQRAATNKGGILYRREYPL